MKWNLKKKISWGIFLLFGMFLISSAYARQVDCLTDQPLGVWRFDEGNGTASQESCYGYNSSFQGSCEWSDGRYGNAVKLNGYDSYIIADNMISQELPDFSVSVWANMSYNSGAWQTLIRRGYYYTDEFLELLLVWNDYNYVVDFDTGSGGVSGNIDIATDGLWHNIVGTYNHTDGNLSLYIDGQINNAVTIPLLSLSATTSALMFGANWDMGWIVNGELDEIAFFNRTLTSAETLRLYRDKIINNNLTLVFYVPYQYPYVDVNSDYLLKVKVFDNSTELTDEYVTIGIRERDNSITHGELFYNISSGYYETTLVFNETGDYYFYIEADSLTAGYANMSGTFLVRQPYYLTFKAYTDKNNASYINNFAYLTAEVTGQSQFMSNNYNSILEKFISPVAQKEKAVFHSPYTNGEAFIKLWENTTYVLRLRDGMIYFPSVYSVPNVTKNYGTNVYLGQYTFSGTNETVNAYFSDSDLHPYFWLFNLIMVIGIGMSIVLAVFLFFMIPEFPYLAIGIGIGFPVMILIFRVVLWFWIG